MYITSTMSSVHSIKNEIKEHSKVADVAKDVINYPITKTKDSALFWQILAITRVYLAFAQTSYIHPDEFHQSLQVVAYDILDIDAAKPWEYSSTSPIRSVAFLSSVSLPFVLLRFMASILKFVFNADILTPNVLLVSSRFFMVLLSFICDFCVYNIAKICYVRPWQCVELFAGSYVMLVYATRTFSNSIELVLFSVLLWRVSLSMVDSTKLIRKEKVIDDLYQTVDSMKEKVKLARLRSKLPAYNFNDSLIISFLVVFGFFVRPTFVIFSFVPVAFWLQRGVVTKEITFWYFNVRFASLIPGAVFLFIVLVLADSFYYQSVTFAELIFWNVTAASFTVTPFNFIMYNSDPENVGTHGSHPYLLHMLVNIPLLFNVLGLVGLYRVSVYFAKLIFKPFAHKPKVFSLATLFILSFIVPVLALSLIPHQEPRFLIPVLPPLILFNADKLSLYSLDKFKFTQHFLFLSWHTFNILCVTFYGFLHQGGVTKTMIFVHNYVAMQPPTFNYNVYFSHMYKPPTFLLMRQIPTYGVTDDGRKFMVPRTISIFDLGSSKSANEIFDTIKSNSVSGNNKTLLCISAPLSKEIESVSNNSLYRIHRISGHISMELGPDFLINRSQLTDCDQLCQVTAKLSEFSIDVFLMNGSPKKSVVDEDMHEDL